MKDMEAKQSEEACKAEEDAKPDDEDVFVPVPAEISQAKEVLDLVKSLHRLCEENSQVTSLSGMSFSKFCEG